MEIYNVSAAAQSQCVVETRGIGRGMWWQKQKCSVRLSCILQTLTWLDQSSICTSLLQCNWETLAYNRWLWPLWVLKSETNQACMRWLGFYGKHQMRPDDFSPLSMTHGLVTMWIQKRLCRGWWRQLMFLHYESFSIGQLSGSYCTFALADIIKGNEGRSGDGSWAWQRALWALSTARLLQQIGFHE